ncbi:hypothetical protein DL771_008415 [Monosporascus sp. 5C6A]|nr:hypothetical protein DL771_008415 [Monosporascus sp. 5C6A]
MPTAKLYHIYTASLWVAYPNRDSTPYKERYGIPEAETIVGGGEPAGYSMRHSEEKIQYEEDERDMVMLRDEFEIETKKGSREQNFQSLRVWSCHGIWGLLAANQINEPSMEELKKNGF